MSHNENTSQDTTQECYVCYNEAMRISTMAMRMSQG